MIIIKHFSHSREIRNLFENEEKIYCKPVRVSIFSCNNCIEYESNDDRNKALSVQEYVNEIRPCLDIINNLKTFDTWKIQLTLANSFISSIHNDEDCVMHSKGDNIEIMISNEAHEIIKTF